ncbi:MAG: SET domain-containing protein [Anaerolineae bacterium]
MLHPLIQLTESSRIQGRGVIATAFIPQGELIWQLDPDEPRIPLSEVLAWPAEKRQEFDRLAFQCGEAEFVLAGEIDRYMNHSCDPNTWWADDSSLIARREIQPAEEVTYDYATSEVLLDFEMSCNCGSALCRKVITNQDYLRPAWQAQYGHYLPGHVLRAIRG